LRGQVAVIGRPAKSSIALIGAGVAVHDAQQRQLAY